MKKSIFALILTLILVPSIGFADYFTGGTYSCSNDGNSACAYSVDTVLTTYWMTNNVSPATWKYDLGAGNELEITEIQINGYADTSHSVNGIKDFTIDGSFDNTSWTTLQTVTNFPQTDNWQVYTLTSTDAYRYYRVNITDNYRGDNYTGMAEIEATAIAGGGGGGTSTSTATSTMATGNIEFGLAIIITLLSLLLISFVWNRISINKPWK
jgi:hypothetical protein